VPTQAAFRERCATPQKSLTLTSVVTSSTKLKPQLMLPTRSTIMTTLLIAASACFSLPCFPSNLAISCPTRRTTSSPWVRESRPRKSNTRFPPPG
jgi:hypothetical protein